jgi:hypothetical protein
MTIAILSMLSAGGWIAKPCRKWTSPISDSTGVSARVAAMQVIECGCCSWCVIDHEQPGRHSHTMVFLPRAADQPAPSRTPAPAAGGGPSGSAHTGSDVRPSGAAASPGHSIKHAPMNKLLSITMAVPEPTAEDVMYKKGTTCTAAENHCFSEQPHVWLMSPSSRCLWAAFSARY